MQKVHRFVRAFLVVSALSVGAFSIAHAAPMHTHHAGHGFVKAALTDWGDDHPTM